LDYAQFSLLFTLTHLAAYLAVGALVYPLLYRPYWEGEAPLFASFLRMRSDEEEWRHTMRWLIPAQIARGLVLSIVLYPVLDALGDLSFGLRFAFVAGLLYVYADLASSVPFSSTVEGLVYMKERFVKGRFLRFQVESLVYATAMGLVVGGLVL
jgi:hypothetical protein